VTNFGRGSMGQSEESEIEVSGRSDVVGTERPLGFCQVGVNVTQNASSMGMRPEIHQIETLVAVDQTDEFASCIARGAKNSSANIHTVESVYAYAYESRMSGARLQPE